MSDVEFSWSRYNDLLIQDRELGFSLDVSRVRFQREDLHPLMDRLALALAAMQTLEAGAIANKDENRMVGHYWLRDPALAPSPELAATISETVEDVRDFAAKIHSAGIVGQDGPFENVLHVGIGGSALGPQFVAAALGTGFDPLSIYFIDNTDPDGIDQILSLLNGRLGATLVVVVSKSGGTPETRNGMLEIQRAYSEQNVDFARHAVAITQAGSQLDAVAQKEAWLKTFPMWDWVGGRTSVLSAVGLVPAALQGLNIDELLAGAAAMDRLTRNADIWKNPAAIVAAMWHHIGGGRGQKDMVILPYKDRLSLFSRYLQQLVMESLGKELDRKGNKVLQGLAVYGNKGSTDQHAYIQQLRDGLNNFFAVFIQVLKDRDEPELEVDPGFTAGDYLQGFLLGTRQALSENLRDCLSITIEEVNGKTVGALIALFERAVGIYAELLDINAYHQPGVEAGKKAASGILALQTQVVTALKESASPRSAEEIATSIGQAAAVETVYKLLEHLAANPSRGVKQQGDGPPKSIKFFWQPL